MSRLNSNSCCSLEGVVPDLAPESLGRALPSIDQPNKEHEGADMVRRDASLVCILTGAPASPHTDIIASCSHQRLPEEIVPQIG